MRIEKKMPAPQKESELNISLPEIILKAENITGRFVLDGSFLDIVRAEVCNWIALTAEGEPCRYNFLETRYIISSSKAVAERPSCWREARGHLPQGLQ